MGLFDPLPPRSSPPPNPRKVVGVIAVYAVAIAFGVALFSGSLPGLPGHITSNVKLDGHEYYSELYWIGFPQAANNSTTPAPVHFHNVTFWVWLTGWDSPQGAYVHGNGTETNGTSFPFVLGGMLSNVSRATLYVSPDARFAAAWSGMFYLELMVEV